MKKNRTLILLVLLFSCTKTVQKGDFKWIIDRLCRARNFKVAAEYYSKDTVHAVNRAVDRGLIKGKSKLSILPLFSPSTKLEIIQSKTSGRETLVRVKYIEHPAENSIGSEFNLKFIMEDGKWKIDMAEDINEVIRRYEKNNGKNYLRRRLSDY